MTMTTVKGTHKNREEVAKFATFEDALVAAAKEQFSGAELNAEILDIQERVIPAAGNYKRSREVIGRILVEKHEKYTKDRVWLQVLDAFVAEFGRCRRTVQNMHTEAALALGAGEKRITAIKRLGLNPFGARLSPVMMKLQNAPAEETDEQAEAVVVNAVGEWKEQKQRASEEGKASQRISEEALFARAVRLVASLLTRTMPEKRGSLLKEIGREALRKAEGTATSANQAEITAPTSPNLQEQNKSGRAANHSPKASSECQPEPVAEQPRHPEYLGCDSILDLDSEALGHGELARRLKETGATRSYIRGGFESIAPHAFAKFLANQVAKHPKHIFLAPTSDPEYFLEVQKLVGGWPPNFWLGLLVETLDQFEGIGLFALIEAKHKWLTISPAHRGQCQFLEPLLDHGDSHVESAFLAPPGQDVSIEERLVCRNGFCSPLGERPVTLEFPDPKMLSEFAESRRDGQHRVEQLP